VLRVGAAPEDDTRRLVAELVEKRAIELYHALYNLSEVLARGVLSALLLTAERVREGDPSMGINITNFKCLADTQPGRMDAGLFFEIHREVAALSLTHPLSQEDVESMRAALLETDRQLQQGAPTSELGLFMNSMSVELQQWLGLAAEQALASASEEERRLWEGRAPVEVVLEGLLIDLRRLQRAFGSR
jgi:hypothetical protein